MRHRLKDATALVIEPAEINQRNMTDGNPKPLGKPAPNARKWFATVEIERMSGDPEWLDKAVRIVEQQIQEMNKKQRDKEHRVSLAQ